MITHQNIDEMRQALANKDYQRVMLWLAGIAVCSGYWTAGRIFDDLKECTLKRDGDDETEVFSILNRQLSSLDDDITHHEHKGEIIDYTQMRPGDFDVMGRVISVCPECGRPGVVSQVPGYFHDTEHITKIVGGGVRENLDVCHLDTGLPWGNDTPRRWVNPGR